MFMEKNSFILSDEEKLSTEQAHLIQDVVDFANQGLKQEKRKYLLLKGALVLGKVLYYLKYLNNFNMLF